MVTTLLWVLLLSQIVAHASHATETMTSTREQDEQEIRRIIFDHYHKGHDVSDGELYRDILHDQWKLFFVDADGKLSATDKETYISWYKPEKRDRGLTWTTEVLYIDVSRNLGSAKIQIRNQQFGFEDYFNLMRIEGKWWIVHKISQRL